MIEHKEQYISFTCLKKMYLEKKKKKDCKKLKLVLITCPIQLIFKFFTKIVFEKGVLRKM